MEILPVEPEDLLNITDLQPPDWNDIMPAFQLYLEHDFCFPFKAVSESQIIGVGAAILNNKTAWLAHIIVHPDHRRQGFGYQITDHLVKFVEEEGCKTISLVATEMGKTVYQKLGFESEGRYTVFKGPEMESQNNFNIRPLLISKHLEEVLKLDGEITGENRKQMIEARIKNGVVYLSDRKVIGYYLPRLGEGPVYAKTEEAGLELIKYKCIKEQNIIGVPNKNEVAIKFLLENQYKEIFSCNRMIRGKKFIWKPECFFARAGGFIG